MAPEFRKDFKTPDYTLETGAGELGLTEDGRVKSIVPYVELLRWRRRFWWSVVLNVGLALKLLWG